MGAKNEVQLEHQRKRQHEFYVEYRNGSHFVHSEFLPCRRTWHDRAAHARGSQR